MKRRFFAIAAVMALAAATFAHPAQATNFITVTSIADFGPGTLRQAIIDANSDGDATIIDFSDAVFSGRIILLTRLPRLLEANTTIDGYGSEISLDGLGLTGFSPGFRVRASGTVIRGLTIQDFPNDGIRIRPNGNGLTVTGVLIQHNTIKRNQDGLLVTGQGSGNTMGVTISNNTIQDNRDDGIVVNGSRTVATAGDNIIVVTIDGNTIDGSKGENNPGLSGDGIRIHSGRGDSMSNTITAFIFNNDIKASFDQGIVVKGAGGNGQTSVNTLNVDIFDNVVQDSGLVQEIDPEQNGSGITIQGGHRSGTSGGSTNTVIFTVSNNTVIGSTQHGIVISGGNAGVSPRGGGHDVSGSVSDNIVRGHTKHGIFVSGGRTDASTVAVTIQDNAVRNNGEQGINVSGGRSVSNNNVVQNIVIRRNITRVNGLSGLSVSLGSGTGNTVSLTNITDNASLSNAQDGIQIGLGILGGGATPISGNTANRNGQDGIDIDSTGYLLSDNRADRNAGDGINAIGNTDGGGNTAKGNADCNSLLFCF